MTQANLDQARMMEIPTDKLEISKLNARKKSGDISELTGSIRQRGVLEPLLVRPRGTKYEVVCGSRRLAAARKAGLKSVPCIVNDGISDVESLIVSMTENVQRENLSPEEIAIAYYTYRNVQPDGTVNGFAAMIDMAGTWVGQCLHAYEAATRLQQAGYNVAAKTSPTDEEKKEGMLPVRHLAKIEIAVSALEDKKVITRKEGLKKRLELVDAVKDLNIEEMDKVVAHFREQPQKPIKKIKEDFMVVRTVKEVLESSEARKKLLQDRELVKQAHEQQMNEVVKQIISRAEPRRRLSSPEIGDIDSSNRTWMQARQVIYSLLDAFELQSGRNNATNKKNERLREKGWINVFKHREQEEIDDFIHDYLDVLATEFKLIKDLGEKELQQRQKDLR